MQRALTFNIPPNENTKVFIIRFKFSNLFIKRTILETLITRNILASYGPNFAKDNILVPAYYIIKSNKDVTTTKKSN